MPVTAFQVDIVRAIREAFDQLRFKYASADRHQYVDGRRVWVPWQEDPLEGEAGWTTAVKTTLCRVGQENFGFGVGCHGVPDSDALHPHMLRHTCGFYLANQGYDLRLIQDYFGHRDPKHTVHYTRVAGVRFEGMWGT